MRNSTGAMRNFPRNFNAYHHHLTFDSWPVCFVVVFQYSGEFLRLVRKTPSIGFKPFSNKSSWTNRGTASYMDVFISCQNLTQLCSNDTNHWLCNGWDVVFLLNYLMLAILNFWKAVVCLLQFPSSCISVVSFINHVEVTLSMYRNKWKLLFSERLSFCGYGAIPTRLFCRRKSATQI